MTSYSSENQNGLIIECLGFWGVKKKSELIFDCVSAEVHSEKTVTASHQDISFFLL